MIIAQRASARDEDAFFRFNEEQGGDRANLRQHDVILLALHDRRAGSTRQGRRGRTWRRGFRLILFSCRAERMPHGKGSLRHAGDMP